ESFGGISDPISNDTATAIKGGTAGVLDAASSSASATNAGSQAYVGSINQDMTPNYITNSSAVDNQGTITVAGTSDTHLVNSPVEAQARMAIAPNIEARLAPSLPVTPSVPEMHMLPTTPELRVLPAMPVMPVMPLP